ncbi:MAG: hypothetical protein P1U56_04780 [Saprospiraceae bacterium]|nr:hypothetical protein [Saprospiraceae bacterium]
MLVIFVITCYSCATTKSIVSCTFNPEKNEIIGNNKKAKAFMSYNNNNYIPIAIEELLYNNRNVISNYKEPLPQYAELDSLTGNIKMVNNPQAKSLLRGGYKIKGCTDTTWAKKKMADHLLRKYQLSRQDSFFINDIFTYSFNLDSIQLLKSHEDLNIIVGLKKSRGFYECLGCNFSLFISGILDERGYKFRGIKRYELNHDQTFFDTEFLTKEKFDFSYYFKAYKDVEIDEVISTLRNKYGIMLTHERTDTVRMGVYNLDE